MEIGGGLDMNMKSIILVCSILCIILSGVNSQMNDSEIETVKKMLRSPKLIERKYAVDKLLILNKSDYTKAEILLIELINEIDNPTKEYSPGFSTYLPPSEFVCRQYMIGLGKLGKGIVPLLKEHYRFAKNEDLREKLILIMAYIGEKEYYENLVEIIKKSKNIFNREFALHIIYKNKWYNSDLIPLYKELLNDPNCFRKRGDVIGAEEYENYICPLRQKAYAALSELGFKIKRVKNEFYIIDDGK
jgi:hypothetical protein